MKSSTAVIDSHVHLLETTTLRYPWLKNVPDIHGPYRPADYYPVRKANGVAAYIAVEAAVDGAQKEQELTWLNQMAKADPALAGIIAYADVSKGEAVRSELERIVESNKVCGIRFTLGAAYQPNPKLCLTPSFIAGVRQLARYGLSFDMAFDPSQFEDMYAFARACPHVQLVINHTAKPVFDGHTLEPWFGTMRKMAALPNVVCKVSDILRDSKGHTTTALFRPFVDRLLDLFGPKRLMFGSDFPVVTAYGTYEAQLSILRELLGGLSLDEQQAFFCETARRVYNLTINDEGELHGTQ